MLPDGCGLTTMLCDDRRDDDEQLPRVKLASLPSPIACELSTRSVSAAAFHQYRAVIWTLLLLHFIWVWPAHGNALQSSCSSFKRAIS